MFSRLFFIVMQGYVHTALWFFFRKWQVHGEQNIPKHAGVIYIVNHQNAFLDAILIACSTEDEPWFLTRGGVFKNKIARAIFHSFHMIPVYRFRDGVKGLRNNDATFRACVDLLKNKKSILVFGEGDQAMRYQLRVLQKGFARIALTVQEESDWKLPLYVVPVGVQYDHYYNFRSRVLINYGKPFPIDESYRSLPEREFYDTLLAKSRKELLLLMLHIEGDNYEAIEKHLRHDRTKSDLVEQLHHDQLVITNWKDNAQPTELKKSKNYFLLILTLPLHLYAWVNNFAPYIIIKWLLKKYVTPEFYGSLKVGFGMVIAPLFYLIQSAIVQTIFSDWRITLAYLFTLPFLSIWSVDLFKKAIRME
jgi:1-acyl-sn-glycerol-3-phosphate acyltransferase